MSSLVRAGFFQQLRELYGPPQTYEFSLAFQLGPHPSATFAWDFHRLCCAIKFRRDSSPRDTGRWDPCCSPPCWRCWSARVVLAPIGRISEQLDRISAGQFDAEPVVERSDELGAVSTKIIGIGKQLRDVREIFSTLRENLDQVMSGLEDGLLLFNGQGRAVLVSPSIEKFLGGRADELRGRRVARFFRRGIRCAAC